MFGLGSFSGGDWGCVGQSLLLEKLLSALGCNYYSPTLLSLQILSLRTLMFRWALMPALSLHSYSEPTGTRYHSSGVRKCRILATPLRLDTASAALRSVANVSPTITSRSLATDAAPSPMDAPRIMAESSASVLLKTDGGKRWIQDEPDPRQVQIALADLGLDKCKPMSTPGSNGREK
eukprot:6491716-Amphidinium_carterae.1